MRIKIVIIFVLLVIFITGITISLRKPITPVQKEIIPTPTIVTTPTPIAQIPLAEPIAEFRERMTKKFFGTYITPANSPVTPERFTGYHTGVDVEYADVNSDVPVFAIADGIIIASEYASGYGGVMVIKHEISGKTLYAVYGHLKPISMLKTGTNVTQGRKIGVLGTGYSSETDGERRHLHFAIAKTNTITGYTSSKSELNSNWIDPLSLYK